MSRPIWEIYNWKRKESRHEKGNSASADIKSRTLNLEIKINWIVRKVEKNKRWGKTVKMLIKETSARKGEKY